MLIMPSRVKKPLLMILVSVKYGEGRYLLEVVGLVDFVWSFCFEHTDTTLLG